MSMQEMSQEKTFQKHELQVLSRAERRILELNWILKIKVGNEVIYT